MTGTLVYIAYIEEFKKLRESPVEINVVSKKQDILEFEVKNKTGERLTGGTKIGIMPRMKKLDNKEAILPRFNPMDVVIYITNKNLSEDFLNKNLKRNNAPMYCGSPASLDQNEWRGYWTTYLDPEGGDKLKMISTNRDRFSVYRLIYNKVLNQIHKIYYENENLKFEDINNNASELIKWYFKQDIVKNYYSRKNNDNYFSNDKNIDNSNEIWLEKLIDCIFPSFNLEDIESIELVLKNIVTYKFVKKEGYWIKESEEKI